MSGRNVGGEGLHDELEMGVKEEGENTVDVLLYR